MSHDNEMEFLHAGPGYIVLTELLNYLKVTGYPFKSDFTIVQEDGTEVKNIILWPGNRSLQQRPLETL